MDRTTSGNTAHVGLTYYFYPVSNCGSSCQLDVGFISSTDGGATWGSATQLAGPMTLSWLANTSQGFMVGDYISTSFSGGLAHGVFAVASANNGTVFDEAMFTNANGLTSATAGTAGEVASADHIPPGIYNANQHDKHSWH